MRLRDILRQLWERLRGLAVPTTPETTSDQPYKLRDIPIFPLPRANYEVSLSWDSESDISPHSDRRRHVVGWVQKKRQSGYDPGDDEDGYDGARAARET